MEVQPINPGSVNLIYSLTKGREVFNRAEIMNGTIEDRGMTFDYRIDKSEDFIKLSIDIQYTHFAKESEYELPVLQAPYSFHIKKVSEIFPMDLQVVLEYCIKGINHAASLQSPLVKNLPNQFSAPLYEDHKLLLQQIAQDLNDIG